MERCETFRQRPESRDSLLEKVRRGEYFKESRAVVLDSTAVTDGAGATVEPVSEGAAEPPPGPQPPKR